MTVTTACHGHVAIVTFARPPSNFADLALIEEIGTAFDAADADREVRAIVLQSDGRVFCAGADLANANPVAEGRTDGERNPFYVAAARLFGVRKPVVAAVQGAAVGAGLGLALVADFRVAGPDAKFVANFVALGFHPGFGISAVLERVIGRQRALLMNLTGRRIGQTRPSNGGSPTSPPRPTACAARRWNWRRRSRPARRWRCSRRGRRCVATCWRWWSGRPTMSLPSRGGCNGRATSPRGCGL